MDNRPLILWHHHEWRCEFHPGLAGQCRLVVYCGDRLAAAESSPTGQPAYLRAEMLRHRVLRGELKTSA